MNYRRYSIVLLCAVLLAGCHHTSPTALQPVGATSQATRDAMEAMNRMLTEQDEETIRTYTNRHNLSMQRYDEGYYGMIVQAGTGPFAVDGTTLSLRATIRLLDGEVCYSDKEITFKPGKTSEIPGLHRVAASLQKGTKARYVFPPFLAYGIDGDGNKIPPRSILEYEIEVLDVY